MVNEIDLDQVRRDVARMHGKWVREGNIIVSYGDGSPARRKAMTRIGVSFASDDFAKETPVLVVEGRDSGRVRDKLKSLGYTAVSGTISEL